MSNQQFNLFHINTHMTYLPGGIPGEFSPPLGVPSDQHVRMPNANVRSCDCTLSYCNNLLWNNIYKKKTFFAKLIDNLRFSEQYFYWKLKLSAKQFNF